MMPKFRVFLAQVQALFTLKKADEELEGELQEHLRLLTERFVRQGMPPSKAAIAARRQFGNVALLQQRQRETRTFLSLSNLCRDIVFGARILRKSRGFTAIAVFSLALAIGANTAIFSIAKQLLYDRLDVPQPQQLRLLGWVGDNKVTVHAVIGDFDGNDAGMTRTSFSYPVYRDLRAHNRALEDLFAFKEISMNATIRGNAQPLSGVMVSGNYYSALGVRPQLGRAIQETDDGVPGAGAVVVISDGLWQREFDRSSAVLGQTIKLNGTLLTIVGVNPPGFTGVGGVQASPDAFVPLAMQPQVYSLSVQPTSELNDSDLWWLNVMGRLKPGTRDVEESAALDVALAAAVRNTMTVGSDETLPHLILINGSRGMHQMTGIKKPVAVLLVLVAVVLLLACANIATLLLARATRRRREMSVRMALGAARWRILSQLLTENLLLAALGGLGGLLIGYMARNVVPALLWQRNTRGIHFDWGVFVYAALITILTALLFGLAPAWTATHTETAGSLQESSHTSSRRHRASGGRAIVIFQIALSTLLVVAAGLFLRTVYALSSVDLGFRPDHVLLFEINPPAQRYPQEKEVRLRSQLERAFSSVPGVQSETFMSIPYIADYTLTTFFETEEEAAVQRRRKGERVTDVGNNFFQTLGIPIIAGRSFGPQDTATSPEVAIINQSLARSRFPHGNPVGKRLKFGIPLKDEWVQVIGICDDTRYANLRDNAPQQFFVPYVQRSEEGGGTYAVRTPLQPSMIVPTLRQVVQQADPDLPIVNIRTQREQIDESMRMERTFAALTTGFGALALALACVGVFGVMAYSVAQRTNEIGIRMALGAQPGQVKRMILCESTLLAAVGISGGIAGVLLLSRLVNSMLYGIRSYDPVSMVVGILILLAVALTASWIPARRAAGVQPMEALRHE
jgi:predicted permease